MQNALLSHARDFVVKTFGFLLFEPHDCPDDWRDAQCSDSYYKCRYASRFKEDGSLQFTIWDLKADATYTTFIFEDEKGEAPSAQEILKRKELKAQQDQQKIQDQLKVQQRAQRDYQRWTIHGGGQSNYLMGKKLPMPKEVPGFYPAIVIGDEQGLQSHKFLVIPMYDKDRVIWNYQKIPGNGDSRFPDKGGRAKGLIHDLPTENKDKILIGEGYATCLAAHFATNLYTRVAFSLGQLRAAILMTLEEGVHPSNIILLADCDGKHWLDPDPKKRKNPGYEACEKLSKEFGVKVALPTRGIGEKMDFCDHWQAGEKDKISLMVREALAPGDFEKWMCEQKGLRENLGGKVVKEVGSGSGDGEMKCYVTNVVGEVGGGGEGGSSMALVRKIPVRSEINSPPCGEKLPEIIENVPAEVKLEIVNPFRVNDRKYPLEIDVEPLLIRLSEGKHPRPILPSEDEAVQALLKHHEGFIYKIGEDIFGYTGTHWAQINAKGDDGLYRQIDTLYSRKASDRSINASLRRFKRYIDSPPSNLHTVLGSKISFKNGTLEATRTKKRWELKFKSHDPKDFVTNHIPCELDLSRTKQNPLFDSIIEKVTGGDMEALRALKQMFGACLFPHFPHFFLIKGHAGGGKSTIIKLAVMLCGQGNASQVGPGKFETFLAETMIGKMINYDTDLDSSQPLDDNMIKKVEDRLAVTINRKNRIAITGCLPPIHLYGCNNYPPTKERTVGAYSRRFTFIELQSFRASVDDRNYDKEIVDRVCELGMEGMVNFALEGLEDLLTSNGHYFVSERGKMLLEKWQADNDSVQSFINDVKLGEVRGVRWNPGEGRIPTLTLYGIFKPYVKDNIPNPRAQLSKNKFYQALEDKGFVRRTIHGKEHFVGFEEVFRTLPF